MVRDVLWHGWVPLIRSHYLAKLWKSIYYVFSVWLPCKVGKEEMLGFHFGTWLYVATLSRGLMSSWVTSWVPLITSHYYLAESGSHRSSRKGDVLFLICSRDHVVIWCYGWMLLILIITTQVLYHFLLKIHNWLVITCVDLWLASPESLPELENIRQIPLMRQLSFYIDYFWSH